MNRNALSTLTIAQLTTVTGGSTTPENSEKMCEASQENEFQEWNGDVVLTKECRDYVTIWKGLEANQRAWKQLEKLGFK